MSEISKYKSNRVALFVIAILIAAEAPRTAEAADDFNCTQFNHHVADQLAKGEMKEAEAALSEALPNTLNQAEGICAGLILHNLATIMLGSGRLAAAETFAERALNALGKNYPPNNPMLLRPLLILCSALVQQGKIGAARQAFERMRSIPAGRPADRALVQGLRAMLLIAEGKVSEAEEAYLAAAAAFEQAGLLQTANAGTNLAALALPLYSAATI